MKTRVLLVRLLFICLSVFCGIDEVIAQGVIVYKKDNTKLRIPFEQLDSVVTSLDSEDFNIKDDDHEESVVPKTESITSITYKVNGVSFIMKKIEAGSFQMGSTAWGHESAQPIHMVTLSRDYFMAETEVTQELWEAIMGSNPSQLKGGQRPVHNVSWEDCQDFINKLRDLTGVSFRLPSEAEWEFAARGGVLSKGYTYAGSNSIDDVAYYDVSLEKGPFVVKQKRPNELGLYDMTANVFEWCQDWYSSSYYSISPDIDPVGPDEGKGRVQRGGCFNYSYSKCTNAAREWNSIDSRGWVFGFRLASW